MSETRERAALIQRVIDLGCEGEHDHDEACPDALYERDMWCTPCLADAVLRATPPSDGTRLCSGGCGRPASDECHSCVVEDYEGAALIEAIESPASDGGEVRVRDFALGAVRELRKRGWEGRNLTLGRDVTEAAGVIEEAMAALLSGTPQVEGEAVQRIRQGFNLIGLDAIGRGSTDDLRRWLIDQGRGYEDGEPHGTTVQRVTRVLSSLLLAALRSAPTGEGEAGSIASRQLWGDEPNTPLPTVDDLARQIAPAPAREEEEPDKAERTPCEIGGCAAVATHEAYHAGRSAQYCHDDMLDQRRQGWPHLAVHTTRLRGEGGGE